MNTPADIFGDGPKAIDRERALRRMLAVLDADDERFFATLAAMLDDDEDRPALAATLSTLFVLANDMATTASNRLGADTARQVMLDDLANSLRGEAS